MTLMTKDRKNTRKEQILLTALKIACNENKDKIIKCIKESEQRLIDKKIIDKRSN